MFQKFRTESLHTWCLAAILILFTGCAGLPTLPPASISSTNEPKYKIIIDAGSSGSRLFAYRVERDENSALPDISLVGIVKVNPGISQFEQNPLLARKNLNTLVSGAKKLIPSQKWEDTSVHLFATAGMRLLSNTKRERILSKVDAFFKTDGSFYYHGAMVLEGKFEGLYSWLAVNYLDDRFSPDQQREHLLEMGGGSAQITFTILKGVSPNIVRRTIGGKTYSIYTKSYLYMGEDTARKFASAPSCFPKEYFLANEQLHGEGNFDRCVDDLVDNFNGLCENLEENGPHCIFKGNLFSPSPGNYFALSAYYYLYDFLTPENQSRDNLFDVYQQDGGKFCSYTWAQIQEKYPSEKESYLKNYCFNSAYFYLFLARGLKLNPLDHHITPVSTINGVEVSWTLGAVLDILLGNSPKAYPDGGFN